MHAVRISAMAVAILLGTGLGVRADVTRTGLLTGVGERAIELNGERILLGPKSRVRSEGREVTPASLRPGMYGEAEVDDAGRLIHLDVNGVVE